MGKWPFFTSRSLHSTYPPGIHNESGIEKRKLPPARDLISSMLSYITNTSDPDRSYLPFKHDGKDKVVLMVNNLGGLSELEMGLIAQEALGVLDEQGIDVVRINVGSFMVSLYAVSCPRRMLICSTLDIMQPSGLQLDPPSSPAVRGQAEVHGRTSARVAGRAGFCSGVETAATGRQGCRCICQGRSTG